MCITDLVFPKGGKVKERNVEWMRESNAVLESGFVMAEGKREHI